MAAVGESALAALKTRPDYAVTLRSALIGFLEIWQPKKLWLSPALRSHDDSAATMPPPRVPGREPSTREVWLGLMPWIIVCVILLVWGTGWFKGLVNPIFSWNYDVPGLDKMISKVAPVVAQPTPERATFAFTYLSFTGSGMLIAAIISGFLMGFSPAKLVVEYGKTIRVCAYSLITISAMLAIGTLTRLSGIDATGNLHAHRAADADELRIGHLVKHEVAVAPAPDDAGLMHEREVT